MDWRRQENWGCNLERNPYGQHYLDGSSLEAMEVMFVKVKHNMVLLNYPSAIAAVAYDDWMNHTTAVRPRPPPACLP